MISEPFFEFGIIVITLFVRILFLLGIERLLVKEVDCPTENPLTGLFRVALELNPNLLYP